MAFAFILNPGSVGGGEEHQDIAIRDPYPLK
jgi:hypothetical protein